MSKQDTRVPCAVLFRSCVNSCGRFPLFSWHRCPVSFSQERSQWGTGSCVQSVVLWPQRGLQQCHFTEAHNSREVFQVHRSVCDPSAIGGWSLSYKMFEAWWHPSHLRGTPQTLCKSGILAVAPSPCSTLHLLTPAAAQQACSKKSQVINF